MKFSPRPVCIIWIDIFSIQQQTHPHKIRILWKGGGGWRYFLLLLHTRIVGCVQSCNMQFSGKYEFNSVYDSLFSWIQRMNIFSNAIICLLNIFDFFHPLYTIYLSVSSVFFLICLLQFYDRNLLSSLNWRIPTKFLCRLKRTIFET